MVMERILGTETGKSAFEKTDRNVVALDTRLVADVALLATHKADNASPHPIYVKKIQESWIDATLQNGWANPLKYRKNEFGEIEFKGAIYNGTTTKDTVLFTLPVGYRPLSAITLNCSTYTTTTSAMQLLLISASGVVSIGATSSQQFINFNDTSFYI